MTKQSVPSTIEIAKRHRSAIKKFMESRGLNTFSWTKRAGLSEGSIRRFIEESATTKQSDSITTKTLAKLAYVENATIGEILGEEIETSQHLNVNILTQAIERLRESVSIIDIQLTPQEEAQAIIHLYDIWMLKGRDSNVSVEMEKEANSILRFIKRNAAD